MFSKNKITVLGITVFFAVSMIYAGGKKDTDTKSVEKPVIAVSIVPEATFAQKVCGDKFDIITMVPPGSDPENYEPTPSEIAKFSKAVLYFTVGVPTEKAHILAQVSKNTKVVHLEDAVAKVYPDRQFADGGRDPHIWLSPKRAVVMVQTIADEVSTVDTKNVSTYKANATAYSDKLATLQGEIADMFKSLKSNKFIVYHPAFGYFAQDFGLEMTALEKEGKDASPQDFINVVNFAKKNNIKVVFYQSEIDSSQSKSLADEIDGVTKPLSPLSGDYINNLKMMAQTIADAQSK